MSEIHLLIITLIILTLWLMNYIKIIPSSEDKAKRELARTVLKERRGIFK